MLNVLEIVTGLFFCTIAFSFCFYGVFQNSEADTIEAYLL